MALPSHSIGYAGLLTYAKESSYGTNPATHSKQLCLRSWSVNADRGELDQNCKNGTSSPKANLQGNLVVAGNASVDIDYDNIDDLFAVLFGEETAGVYSLNDAGNGESASFYARKNVKKAAEVTGAMASKFTIEDEAGPMPAKLNMELIAQDHEEVLHNATSNVDTTGTAVSWNSGDKFDTKWAAGETITIDSTDYVLASVTDDENLILTATAGNQSSVVFTVDLFQDAVETSSEPARFRDMVLRIADQANALVSGDAIKVSKYSLAIDLKQKADDFRNGSDKILKPFISGQYETILTITLPKIDDETLITFLKTAYRDHTKLQADIVYTGLIGSNSLTIELAEMIMTTSPDEAIDDGAATLDLSFTCYTNTSAIMAGNDDVRVTLAT